MSETPLLGLPLLEASQAQKHVTHNEALLLLDAAIHLSVISRSLAAPPAVPVEGDRYLVAASATGDWAGQDGNLGMREASAWRFSVPRSGWRLWVEDELKFFVFDGTIWHDLQQIDQISNLSLLGINTTADTTNRLAVASDYTLLTNVGGGHQIKVNKQGAADTASLLFQTNYLGRAEMGLTGDNDFHVKVSTNGAAWNDAIVIDRATGAVSLPNTAPGSISDGSKGDIKVAGGGGSWLIERTGGAAGDGTTDDTAALQSVLSAGKTVVLGHAKSYLITSRLLITVPGTGIVGDATSRLVMSTAVGHFDNVNSGPDRYGDHGVGIYADSVDRPIVKGFQIAPDTYVDSRRVRAVALKSCTNITVDGIEAWDFSLCGGVITINGCALGTVSHNHIHDCHSDNVSGGQLTGISFDNDTTIDSTGLRVIGNRVVDLIVGTNFIAGTGYDVTGIHFQGREGALFVVRDNYVENVGQGVDIYCQESIFTGNTVIDAYTFGFALKHGASRNIVAKNLVNGAGLRGVLLSGGNTAGDADTAANQIEGNTIRRVGFNGAYSGSSTSGIGWAAGSAGSPADNRIFNNTLDGGGTGKYGIYSDAGAGTGNEVGNNFISSFTVADYSVATGTAAFVSVPGDCPPADGDKGDISVAASGLSWTVNDSAIDQGALLAGDDLANLVANGSLERGDHGFLKQTGWTIGNDSANASAGNWVAKNDNTGNVNYELRSNSTASVFPGDKIYAEAWVKTSASPTIAILRVSIRWLDKDKALLSNSNGTNYTAEQLSYVQSSVTGAAPSGAAYAQICVQTKKSAGMIWADRIAGRRDTASAHVESSPLAAPAGQDDYVTFSHGLGAIPKMFGAWLECAVANNGYSVGERAYPGFFRSNSIMGALSADGSTVQLQFDNGLSGLYIVPKNGGTAVPMSASDWNIILWAQG